MGWILQKLLLFLVMFFIADKVMPSTEILYKSCDITYPYDCKWHVQHGLQLVWLYG